MCGSSGLVVKGRDSKSEGCDFESRCQILDGHFSHLVVVNLKNVPLKRLKINKKGCSLPIYF